MLLVVLDPGTAVAGVFTSSKCASAPVEWCRAKIKAGTARALVVNAGNANAFTGSDGREACAITAKLAAEAVGCKPGEVLLASTGVIGKSLDARKFEGVMGRLASDARLGGWLDAARAIMTTDTYPKLGTISARIGNAGVTIVEIAKGATMIAPDMATTLSFIFTDAPIVASCLQVLLREAIDDTFNALTIDGDTSTSDTSLVFATGAAEVRGAPKISSGRDGRLAGFRRALAALLADLAEQVARDGQGAKKLIRIEIEGAVSKVSARRIAMSIANSTLVKDAFSRENANWGWGRVVMAVGKAAEPINRDKLSIWFNGVRVARNGMRDSDYDEVKVSSAIKHAEIFLKVALGLGRGRDRVLTCDLTKNYTGQ